MLYGISCILYYIILYDIILILYYISLYYFILFYYIILYYIILVYTILFLLYYIILYYTILYYSMLYYIYILYYHCHCHISYYSILINLYQNISCYKLYAYKFNYAQIHRLQNVGERKHIHEISSSTFHVPIRRTASPMAPPSPHLFADDRSPNSAVPPEWYPAREAGPEAGEPRFQWQLDACSPS